MKRDWNLIRDLVLLVADGFAGPALPSAYFRRGGEADHAKAAYHAWLLVDGGLVRGVKDGPALATVHGLTDEGREFAELAQDGDVWSRVMAACKKHEVRPTYDGLKELLKWAAEPEAAAA